METCSTKNNKVLKGNVSPDPKAVIFANIKTWNDHCEYSDENVSVVFDGVQLGNAQISN